VISRQNEQIRSHQAGNVILVFVRDRSERDRGRNRTLLRAEAVFMEAIGKSAIATMLLYSANDLGRYPAHKQETKEREMQRANTACRRKSSLPGVQ